MLLRASVQHAGTSESPAGVEVTAVRALMRTFQLECEGVNVDADRRPLPREVAGYFWLDDEAPESEHDGRSPLGVVLTRLRLEVDTCSRLGDEERLLLSHRHGLSGAVRRLNDVAAGSTSSGAVRTRRAPSTVEITRSRTTLHRACWHLAQTLKARPDDRVTLAAHRSDPVSAPWFERHLLSCTDDTTRHLVGTALDVARQWCAVGGLRQERLLSDLSCWHDTFARGCPPPGVVNLRRRLWRANAYVGIALYRTIAVAPAALFFTSALQVQGMPRTA